jgi:hypothetical protein
VSFAAAETLATFDHACNPFSQAVGTAQRAWVKGGLDCCVAAVSVRSGKCSIRPSGALPNSAQSQTFLRDYFRTIKARLGPAKGMSAIAQNLARSLYHLLKNQRKDAARVFQDQER